MASGIPVGMGEDARERRVRKQREREEATAESRRLYGPDLGELSDIDVSLSAAITLYSRLPLDRDWLDREDLRPQAALAGWCEAEPVTEGIPYRR